MIGLSVCSGIGAPEHSAPWVDWRYHSEIEKFPAAVFAERYPDSRNLGDMKKWREWDIGPIDILCGGTPCQSFSVAGLRQGLADPRGNLMLTYLAIADRYRPEWLVWENVPGVLSSDGGRDFGAFIGGLEQLGYNAAWRVFDAQYTRTHGYPRAVPQRRRRVFVVGHLGDWRRAAAVLFDAESLRGDTAPRRETGENAGCASHSTGGGGLGADVDCDGGLISSTGPVAHCLNAGGMGRQDFETETMIAHSLRGEGLDAIHPSAEMMKGGPGGTGIREDGQAVAFGTGYQGDKLVSADMAWPSIPAKGGNNGGGAGAVLVAPMAVRRLTPTECERLMGFPDDWTRIPWRGKSASQCPDGPRYKALGNSWAINCGQAVFDRLKWVAEQ